MKTENHFDVIVIGVGSMGSAACYHLAARGHRVLGLEQFGIVHDQGSHFGQSRIIRQAYFEHPDYVPLLQRAYDNWETFEKATNSKVYFKTGVIYFGEKESATLTGINQSASQYQLPVRRVKTEEVKKHFPAFSLPLNFDTLFEPEAGFLTPERTIRLYARQAESVGATIRTGERVLEWKDDGSTIKVLSSHHSYRCNKLVITSGSWTSKLVPEMATKLKVTRQTLAWVNPKNPEQMSLGNFPCWFIDDPERGMFYGFPILPFENFGGPIGLKVASHQAGPVVDPDRVDRSVGPDDEQAIRYLLNKYFPQAGDEIITLKTCLYTYSDDENFIIDHVPGHDKKVVIACGFSGHGFKFVSAVGEILADLALNGKTDLPIGFLALNRFPT